MKTIGVIPARYHSTRLPQKMLRDLQGAPLIQRVWENAKKATKLSDIIIATDHQEIFNIVQGFGAKVMMTDPNHPSGTDRIQEVAGHVDCDVIVNVQGDEPFLEPEAIDHLAEAFTTEPDLQMATLCFRSEDVEAYHDPHVVKLVTDHTGHALLFSRSPLPYFREKEEGVKISFLKHFGVYGYKKDFLLQYGDLKPSKLEAYEKLEQLRVLENGYKIRAIEMTKDSLGIDTAEDLQKANEIYRAIQASR